VARRAPFQRRIGHVIRDSRFPDHQRLSEGDRRLRLRFYSLLLLRLSYGPVGANRMGFRRGVDVAF